MEIQSELNLQFRHNTKTLAALLLALAQAKNEATKLYILPHHRADGDAIGSAFGLNIACQKLGLKSEVLLAEPVPPMYAYLSLPDYAVLDTEAKAAQFVDKLTQEQAYVCLIDNSAPETRLGVRFALWQVCQEERRLIIDHHVSDITAGERYDIAANEIACSGMVAELIILLEKQSGQSLLDANLANCLMTGIITDSGQLSYAATSAQTYLLMAILKQHGADQELINRVHYHTMSVAKLKMIALAFSQTEFSYDNTCLVSHLTAEQIQQAQAGEVDLDGISSMLREVRSVKVAVLLRSTLKGNVLGSIRSTEAINCQNIAKQLGGGGHERASGFTIYNVTLEEAKAHFLSACKTELESEDAE